MPPRPLAQISAADRARALTLTPVSRETEARLEIFVDLLLQWQTHTNLVAPSTIPNLWTRHIADSLQLLNLAPSVVASGGTFLDIGSGAGFPGLMIAIARADSQTTVHLVESTGKKAVFLREAVQATGAPAEVHAERAEDFIARFRGRVDVVTARAVAPLDRLLALIAPVVQRGAQALLMKGQDVAAELTAASKYWRIEADLVPSVTDPHGRILVVRRLERSR